MLLLIFTLVQGVPAAAGTFQYEAFIAGAKAGSATVTIELTDDGYRLSGAAAADGLVDLFSDWRTRFRVSGRRAGNTVEPGEYHYLEHEGDQMREVTVRNGRVQYSRSGKPPREFEAPASLDVLTALFVRPDCTSGQEVHTGRRKYRLVPLKVEDGLCTFNFIDEDNDRVRVDIRYAQRDEYLLPVRMTVHGFLRGTIRLVE